MKILLVTGLYDKNCELTYQRSCRYGFSIQNAPNVFQWCIVDGLVNNHADFHVVSYPFLPTYPRGYLKRHVDKTPIIKDGIIIGTSDKYCTLPVLKSISIYNNLYKYAKEWIEVNNDETKVIIVYAPESYVLSALIKLKREFANVSVCMIVTDMVEDMLSFASNRTLLKRVQVKKEQKIMKSLYKDVNKFVLLSKHMCDRIPYAINNHIIVEGIYSIRKINTTEEEKISHSLLYTGALEEFCGVRDLVDAFMMTTSQSYKLVLCGSGCLSSYIEDCARKDKRIIFKGLVSREEALKLQQLCTVLINPRKPNGQITKYSFPSKTMEYLTSGTPMIGYKLEGIPEEYYDYFYTIDNLDTISLKNSIETVLHKDRMELTAKAEQAYKFICQNKNSMSQVRKILEYIYA